MRRYTTTLLAAAVGLVLVPATALAGGGPLDVTNPVVGNEEFAGLDTIVSLSIPSGLDPVELADTEAIIANFNLIDADGTILFGPIGATLVGGPIGYDDAAGNDIQIDLSLTNFSAGLSNASVTAIQMIVSTASGSGLTAVFDMDEATDESLTKDITDPSLASAFYDSDNDTLFLVFSESLNNGDANNDDNHTDIGDIDGSDFQFDTANSFDGTEGAPAGLSNEMFIGADNTTIQFDNGGTDIDVGVWIRPNFDDMDASQNDLRDIVGNMADDTAVQITELADLALVSAEWVESVPAGGGGVANALRVTFNNPLDSGDLGDTDFYNTLMLGGEASDITVTGVAADPDDASSVLLSVDASGDDGVAANGTDETTGDPFSVDLDDANGDPPSDIFSQDFAGTDSEDIDDAIIPALAGGFGSPAYVDQDGDGLVDGFKLVFNETLAAGSASTDGMEARRNDGVTVHPADQVDLVTGERTEATVSTADDADDDIIPLTGAVLGSTDANGDGDIGPGENNNTVIVSFDPEAFDWDDDGLVGALDTDGEAFPGTDDDSVFNVSYTADDGDIDDEAGNAFDTDLTNSDASIDCAAPALLSVNFFTGDNLDSGMQKISEQDGNVGDQDDNNVAQLVFSEEVNDGDIDETEFRFGPGPGETFEGGDSDGTFGDDDNVLQLTDNDGNGWVAGSSLSIGSDNGVEDNDGNAVEPATNVASTNQTAPYVALQSDVNGNTIFSAFLVDTDADGFANQLDIFFNAPIDSATVEITDFSVAGVTDAELDTANPTGPNVSGSRIRLLIPDDTLAISSDTDVTYNGGADDTPIAGTDGNAVADMNDTFSSQQVPSPAQSTQDVAIMDITGAITLDGTNAVPAGTKVFAFVVAPRAKAVRGTMANLQFVIDEFSEGGSSSLEAVTDLFLGLAEFLYMYESDGDMFIDSQKFDDGQTSITQMIVNATNLTNVSYTGRGITTTGGNAAPTATSITAGTIRFVWDVLRSGDGTIRSLLVNGTGDCPIVSATVIGDDSGAYRLHVSAPIAAFTGLTRFASNLWPVIIVVELPTGERFACSSLLTNGGTLNASATNRAAITFNPDNRRQNTDGSAAATTTFDVRLDRIGIECLFEGWNLLEFARAGGFATVAGQLPVLPRGVATTDVQLGSTLPNATTLSQFVYFFDDNGDGEWTSDDDDDCLFDSLFVDVNCLEHFAFVINSRGVQVSSARSGVFTNGILAHTGGYAVGFFNGFGSENKLGVFQFGAPIVAGPVFSSSAPFVNSNVNLGWALVTYVANGDSDTPVEFFTANPGTDYLIEFNRTDHDEVTVSSSRRTSASTTTGDNQSVGSQGLFVHYTR